MCLYYTCICVYEFIFTSAWAPLVAGNNLYLCTTHGYIRMYVSVRVPCVRVRVDVCGYDKLFTLRGRVHPKVGCVQDMSWYIHARTIKYCAMRFVLCFMLSIHALIGKFKCLHTLWMLVHKRITIKNAQPCETLHTKLRIDTKSKKKQIGIRVRQSVTLPNGLT